MSTQTSGFPPVGFSTTLPQQSYRLMELPPDLVALIETSSNDKRPLRLQFKSSSSQTSDALNGQGSADTPAEGHLHLCSDDKVWAVKQVSTSNSVHVTKTSTPLITQATPSTNGDINMHMDVDTYSDSTPIRGITSIAQVKNVLELLPVEPDLAAIERQIKSLTPYTTDSTSDETYPNSRPSPNSPIPVTINQILDNIAAPRQSILTLATRLFLCLSDTDQSTGLKTISIPTPTRLLSAWQDFIQVCYIRGTHVDSAKPTDHTDKAAGISPETFGPIFAEMISDDSESRSNARTTHIDVLRAILRRFKSPPPASTPVQDRDPEDLVDRDWERVPIQGGWDAKGLTLAVGQWILQAAQTQPIDTPNRPGLPVQAFVEKWSRLVPEAWTSYCQVPVLLAGANQDGIAVEISKMTQNAVGPESVEEIISIVQHQPSAAHSLGVGDKLNSNAVGGSGSGSGSSTPAAAASAAPAATDAKKRKWHDKFAAMRNVKK